MAIITDVVRRVFNPNEDACLEIGPWPESAGALELRTQGKENIDFFGAISITMTPEFAAALGRALIAAAQDMENATK